MSIDREVLAERTSAVERHLLRVAHKLPASDVAFAPNTDASDAVILHLWQATLIVLDLALSACAQFRLGTPQGYGDAFVRLQNAGLIEASLARRLIAASGFRNVVAHAYEPIDLRRVHQAAVQGPDDLRAFLAIVRDRIARQP